MDAPESSACASLATSFCPQPLSAAAKDSPKGGRSSLLGLCLPAAVALVLRVAADKQSEVLVLHGGGGGGRQAGGRHVITQRILGAPRFEVAS